jgi:hypothetical protein
MGAPSEKDLVGWAAKQVSAGSKKQGDLCAAFTQAFSLPGDELVEFLFGCKFFRKTGIGDDTVWEVSANRADDLRDYLAE